MTDSVTNRNIIPISRMNLGKFDLDKSYHIQLEKFIQKTDREIEKCCKEIKQHKNATKEEFGDFSTLAKRLGI